MRVAIVDDDASARRQLEAYVRRFAGDEQALVRVEQYAGGRAFLASHAVGACDLVLLDCMLGEPLSGIDVARELRARGDAVPVVLVTSSPDFAVDGYDVGACGYLVKPVSYGKLASTLMRIGAGAGPAQTVVLESGRDSVAVDVRKLTHAEARGHYVRLFDVGGETRVLRLGFGALQERLGAFAQMYCCARGQLVNLDFVHEIADGCFVLTNGERVPIRQRGVAEARHAYATYLFRRLRDEGGEGA